MKRSEFVKIVNDVADEERNAAWENAKKVMADAETSTEIIGKLLVEAIAQAAEIAARSAAKIIERSGLAQFDDE